MHLKKEKTLSAIKPRAFPALSTSDFLENPEKHGCDYKPLKEVFKETDKYIPQDKLYKKYLDYIKKPLPKVIFYIIMRETFEEFGGCETE